jgi:large subunit ribosomal protein LP0
MLPFIKGNVGIIATNYDFLTTKTKLKKRDLSVGAKAGETSPIDIEIPKGNTFLEPTCTSYFQTHNIRTKIVRGCVKVIDSSVLIHAGEQVTISQEKLLRLMEIKPFKKGMANFKAAFFRGQYCSTPLSLLERTDEEWRNSFRVGVRNIAAISMALDEVNAASTPHMLQLGIKTILAISIECNYSLPIMNVLAKADQFRNETVQKKPITKPTPFTLQINDDYFDMGTIFD